MMVEQLHLQFLGLVKGDPLGGVWVLHLGGGQSSVG